MVAKDKFTVPLPPGPPEVTDWSERHMRLEWKEPIDDGGAPITGYHVEARWEEEFAMLTCVILSFVSLGSLMKCSNFSTIFVAFLMHCAL